MAATDEELLLGPKGLPEVTQKEMNEAASGAMGTVAGLLVVPRIIGYGIAFCIFKFATAGTFEERTHLPPHVCYLYLSAVVFSLLANFLNLYPMVFKNQLKLKGNLAANMQFYKMCTSETIMDKPMPYVILEEDGVIGEYNRANRSLAHFGENLGVVLPHVLLAGYAFPLPAFVCVVVFAVGRVLHQVGYAKGGYGKHGPGFGLALLGTMILEGLTAMGALELFGIL